MKKFILLLVVPLLISACGGSPASSTLSTALPTVDESYPAPIKANPIEGYPGLQDSTQGTPVSEVDTVILSEGELPPAPSTVPAPADGMGSISGTLFSFTTRIVLRDTMFYLTPAIGPADNEVPPALFGPQEGSDDVVGRTDGQGQFFMDNVPPGSYFLIVEAPMNWAVGMQEDDLSMPRMITVEAGGKYPLGVVFVPWP